MSKLFVALGLLAMTTLACSKPVNLDYELAYKSYQLCDFQPIKSIVKACDSGKSKACEAESRLWWYHQEKSTAGFFSNKKSTKCEGGRELMNSLRR